MTTTQVTAIPTARTLPGDSARWVTPSTLTSLRAKYVELDALRTEDIEGPPGRDEGSVRRRMAALAVQFPGALREADQLALTEIRARIAALDLVLEGKIDAVPWMAAIILFHDLMRTALSAKRWLNAMKPRAGHDGIFPLAAPPDGVPFPEEARAWQGELERIGRPPQGRVSQLVHERIAQILELSVADTRALVFGTDHCTQAKEQEPRAPRVGPNV